MASDLCRAASQSCISYAAFHDLFHHLCISRWSLPLSYRGWTTVMNRPQSVINAAAQSIAGLAIFHWLLRAPERIKFTLAVIVYRALHDSAPQYLLGQLQYVADLPLRPRGRLRSSTSSLLDVRPS